MQEHTKAFTIIELLVVTLIVVLLALLVPSRGTCDYNIALTDGLVKRLLAVEEGDPQLSIVTLWTEANFNRGRWHILSD